MRFKQICLGLFCALTGLPSAQAYPWMFFRQDKQPGIVKLDTHVSYFIKGQATVFSGLDLNYHHSTVDVNVGYSYSFLEKSHYFRLSELAVVFPFIFEGWKAHLGFKDVLWSEADRYWNYGLWQPRYTLDAFRPVQMGLPGLYLTSEGDLSLLLLLSYFYVPDITIYPKLKEGRISSKNPFFTQPFDQFPWNVDRLESFELNRFFKPVVAFQIQHFIKNSNISFSYAYKPVNQLQYSIHYKGIDVSGAEEDKEGDGGFIDDFKYSVLSHHLASLEGEIVLAESFSLFASLFYENPIKASRSKPWISDDFESHLTFSLLAYFQEKSEEESNILFTLGWTKTKENQSSGDTSNAMTEDLEPFFGRFLMWREALSTSVEYYNKNLFKGFLSRFRVNYALDNRFYALALENYFYLTPHIRMYLSGDRIFRSSHTDVKKSSSSISRYKDLSRVLIGAQYVF